MIGRRCLVAGRVQGVFYRKSAQLKAQELGVTGHARNLPDGRVEILVFGHAAPVEALVAWLWQGSALSRVTTVEVVDIDLVTTEMPRHFVSG